MAILFAKEERERKGFRFPFWGWWILIFILVLGPIIYFIYFEEIPENEITPATYKGLSKTDLEKIKKYFSIMEGQLFQDLIPSIPISSDEVPSIPSEKIGRQNPFAPVK